MAARIEVVRLMFFYFTVHQMVMLIIEKLFCKVQRHGVQQFGKFTLLRICVSDNLFGDFQIDHRKCSSEISVYSIVVNDDKRQNK